MFVDMEIVTTAITAKGIVFHVVRVITRDDILKGVTVLSEEYQIYRISRTNGVDHLQYYNPQLQNELFTAAVENLIRIICTEDLIESNHFTKLTDSIVPHNQPPALRVLLTTIIRGWCVKKSTGKA